MANTMRTGLCVFAALVLVVGAAPVAATGNGIETTQTCTFPVTETDDTGTTVTIESEPREVVALAPNTAQIMWEIGAEEKVTGMPVNSNTAFLDGSESRRDIVDANGRVVTEEVVDLQPDLALAANITSNDAIQKLRDAGVTVFKLPFATSIENVQNQVSLVGELVGACDGAESTVSTMNDRVRAAQEMAQTGASPRVLYFFFDFTTGTGTHIHDVIETAGGDNIAAGFEDGFFQLNDEIVVTGDPQWIVRPDSSPEPSGVPFEDTIAFQQDQRVVLNDNFISQPGPKILVPLARLTKTFNPQALPGDATGNGRDASDPNHDLRFEDVDGDGEFDLGDVRALDANRNGAVVQNNPDRFDFDGNGGVTRADVDELYLSLRAGDDGTMDLIDLTRVAEDFAGGVDVVDLQLLTEAATRFARAG